MTAGSLGADLSSAKRGLLLVVSGPSGSGKSTLVRELMRDGEFPIDFSVSATSRPPRDGEVDGADYWFVDRAKFEALRRGGELLEHAEVHGNLYGTPREPVERALAGGRWILLEIDTQGYRQIKEVMPAAVGFFVRTASIDEYARRLRHRGTETDESLARRLEDVRKQLEEATSYDFQIVNDSLPQAARTFRMLLAGLRSLKKE